MSSNIITAAEAAQLNRARDLLEALTRRCRDEGDRLGNESFAHGYLASNAFEAESAIFDVLNVASAYLHCEVANRAINDRLLAREQAREAASTSVEPQA